MKRVFSILFALLILLSGTQLTVSTHYCGGELAASKVSVWGGVASCGMEEKTTDECTKPGSHLDKHCCNNTISVYEVDHNYSPTFSEIKTIEQPVLQVFALPENISFYSLTSLFQNSANASPPESFLASAVSLPKICIFRI